MYNFVREIIILNNFIIFSFFLKFVFTEELKNNWESNCETSEWSDSETFFIYKTVAEMEKNI